MDKLLSIEEVADYLGVPAGTVYQWRYHGRGPVGHRVGRYVRFRRSDVDAWLDQRRERPKATV